MKITYEVEDLIYVKSGGDIVACGTIQKMEDNIWTLKTGPGPADVEAVDIEDVTSALSFYDGSEFFKARGVDGFFWTDVYNPQLRPSNPYTPTHNIPPGYVTQAGKWHHPIGGDCSCGCPNGGWSSSATSIK